MEGFSFRTKRFRSNIDLIITKSINVAKVCSPDDIWTGSLQHKAVASSFANSQITNLPGISDESQLDVER